MTDKAKGGRKSNLLVVPVTILAVGGLWLAALAGAEDQPTVRAGGYPASTCDSQSQSLDTEITKAPKGKTKSTKAKIEFRAFYCNNSDAELNQGDVNFECSLDGKNEASCTSPISYKKLKKGKHKFSVTAKELTFLPGYGGDPTPANAKWKIKD